MVFFQVGPTHGFSSPCKDPFATLPTRYNRLQTILHELARIKDDGEEGILGKEGEIEKRIAQLPNFGKEVEKESDPFVLQALFRAYAFLASAYTLAPAHFEQLSTGKYGKANQYLPQQIAVPLCSVAKKTRRLPLARLPLRLFSWQLYKTRSSERLCLGEFRHGR